MKKLPKVFQNNINKSFHNNKDYFYSAREDRSEPLSNSTSIEEELDAIFSGIGYPFSDTIVIHTKEKSYETNLIHRGKNHIITIENESIPINSIVSLQRKK